MQKLLISKFAYNVDTETIYEDTDPIETEFTNENELFQHCEQRYKKFVDHKFAYKGDDARPIGWIFEKTKNDPDYDHEYHNNEYREHMCITVYNECEHGHKDELRKDEGRERTLMGVKYATLKNIEDQIQG